MADPVTNGDPERGPGEEGDGSPGGAAKHELGGESDGHAHGGHERGHAHDEHPRDRAHDEHEPEQHPHDHAHDEHEPEQHPHDHAHDEHQPHHAHEGPSHGGHAHGHGDAHGHGHTHGLVDESIKRSRDGLRAVGLALLVLGATAVAQTFVFVASGSVALLADLIHNFGDAATAIPLAIAFALRSAQAERIAGLLVVLAIFVSACVAGYEAIYRLIHPQEPEHLVALALAGLIGFSGNWWAAIIRTRAGRRLSSPALVADGAHARADSYVSLAVVASALAVSIGLEVADPLIGLGITIVILKITRDSWITVRAAPH